MYKPLDNYKIISMIIKDLLSQIPLSPQHYFLKCTNPRDKGENQTRIKSSVTISIGKTVNIRIWHKKHKQETFYYIKAIYDI